MPIEELQGSQKIDQTPKKVLPGFSQSLKGSLTVQNRSETKTEALLTPSRRPIVSTVTPRSPDCCTENIRPEPIQESSSIFDPIKPMSHQKAGSKLNFNEAILPASGHRELYPSGTLRSVQLLEEIHLETPVGLLTPNWQYVEARTKFAPSVTFYETGALKSLRLSQITQVLTTIGRLPAERLTFFPNGALKRLFPVDGKISGFWTLADEIKLNQKIKLSLKMGTFSLYLSGLAFYETGSLRSVTLWPGQSLQLPLPLSEIKVPVGVGFSLFPNGALSSLEPKSPVKVQTPLGQMEAFDPQALGISADRNSLQFQPNGQIKALKSLVIFEADGSQGKTVIYPHSRPHPLDDYNRVHYPLAFEFSEHTVTVSRDLPDENKMTFDLASPIKLRPYIAHTLVNITLNQRKLG
jgi:hypothetical protein